MHREIPQSIESEIRLALSFFPDLEGVSIDFRFKENIRRSTMLAQPKWSSFFNMNNRSYIILISRKFKISSEEFYTKDIPSKVLVGWIGHELGHIKDYETLSRWQLIKFGFNYLFSAAYIRQAECRADHYAIRQGMLEYILATKNFILNHADISERYKNHIKKYYLSPEQIMEMVEN